MFSVSGPSIGPVSLHLTHALPCLVTSGRSVTVSEPTAPCTELVHKSMSVGTV